MGSFKTFHDAAVFNFFQRYTTVVGETDCGASGSAEFTAEQKQGRYLVVIAADEMNRDRLLSSIKPGAIDILVTDCPVGEMDGQKRVQAGKIITTGGEILTAVWVSGPGGSPVVKPATTKLSPATRRPLASAWRISQEVVQEFYRRFGKV